jgi:hypothetical protein
MKGDMRETIEPGRITVAKDGGFLQVSFCDVMQMNDTQIIDTMLIVTPNDAEFLHKHNLHHVA